MGSDILSDRRSHHDPLVWLPRPTGFDTHPLFRFGGWFHCRQRALCHGNEHRSDDRLPRHSRLHRRWHDPKRLCRRFHDLPAIETLDRLADDRPRSNARPDHRTDGWWLSEQRLLLALALSRQCYPRHHCGDCRMEVDRFRQGRPLASQQVRLVGPCRHGSLSWLARIRSRRRPTQ